MTTTKQRNAIERADIEYELRQVHPASKEDFDQILSWIQERGYKIQTAELGSRKYFRLGKIAIDKMLRTRL